MYNRWPIVVGLVFAESHLMPPSRDKLMQKLAEAVHAYMLEDPSIGGARAMEWAVTSRIATYLARSTRVREWEDQHHVRVDAEYAQQGLQGRPKGKVGLNGKLTGKWIKPDLIIHRRTQHGEHSNWLAVEVKLHKGEPPDEPDPKDWASLTRCKELYRYGVALWVSIPRSPGPGTKAIFIEMDEMGEVALRGTLVELPEQG